MAIVLLPMLPTSLSLTYDNERIGKFLARACECKVAHLLPNW